MIREFARLYELTVRELLAAGRRIEQQSGLVLRARLRLRKWCKRWRRMRRKHRKPSDDTPTGRYCEWIASESKYGRLYWQCKYCGRTALRPSTRHEQKHWGQSCPEAPPKEAKCQ